MSEKDVYDEDWGDVEEEVEAASGGIFVKLPTDGSEAYIAFIQKAETRREHSEQYGWGNKTCANVAVFSKGGEAFEGICLLKLAPMHWSDLLEVRREYGGSEVYKIRRKGAKGHTKTRYHCFHHRPLTDAEKAEIAKQDLHDLWETQPDEESNGATAPPRGIKSADYVEWNKAVIAEAKRLGWAEDDKLVENIKLAINIFFGGYIQGTDMDETQRNAFLEALNALETGTAPLNIGSFSIAGDIDLNEDVDFF